jgi:hypothetical protein
VNLAPNSYQGQGSTFGFDLSALYKIPAARLNFGMNVQNLDRRWRSLTRTRPIRSAASERRRRLGAVTTKGTSR